MLILREDDLNRFKTVLGDEIRIVRKRDRQWKREELRDQLVILGDADELSVQTLATYEQGTRSMTVTRLLQIANALNVPADELLGRALRRALPDCTVPDADQIAVNVEPLMRPRDARLQPLSAWAKTKYEQAGYNPYAVVNLDSAGIDAFSARTNMSRETLLTALCKIGAVQQASAAA